MRKLNVEIGGVRFTANANERAPKTVDALSRLLPIDDSIMHSRFAGEAIWFNLKGAPQLEYENHSNYFSRGEIGYYPGSFHANGILIAYGAAVFNSKVGPLSANHFASIVENHDALAEMGMRLLREGAKPIRLTQAE